MMEHPSIMSPAKNCLKISLHLPVFALSALLLSCSTNDEFAAPVTRTSTAPSGSASLEPNAGNEATSSGYNQQTLQLINEPVPLAEGHPDRYTVKKGDTLWDISAVFLRDPWYWPEVWYVNPQVENPHLIYPGDVLSLVYVDGQMRIVNERISAYRLSPQARSTPLTEAIASIPYEQIAAFLSKGIVLEKEQADRLP